ncbi:DNA repair and recombination protein RadA [Candidatus Nitrosocosmicus franklandus]|uniref:DNA repair and recombination protein RadA n=1 Tax=Candidatus Nitrosocosmicus franklandianus TaxID=1798806 RepID=A0A484IG01_9ARCH|nr:DNA repair and recombination protein RadA [Candidatus Nitrosocosmicus franklandus]VFJ14574.1 DNA repair and recombination protein RadA [Candidatus Nitrosocosmicus franklandus]
MKHALDPDDSSFNQKSKNESLSVDLLRDLSDDLISQLKRVGFLSLKDIVIEGPSELSSKSGLSINESNLIYNLAITYLEDMGIMEMRFTPATTIYHKRKKIGRISTGSRNFDKLLGGGIETNAITEVYGEFGTGKTQLCHTVSVMVQLNQSEGGLDGRALYVDTENTFRPERIETISKTRNQDPDKILDNIIVAKAYSSAHQELILSESSHIIESQDIKLLIFDSAISLYRSEFIGLSSLSLRQQRLNKLFHSMMRIAQTHQVAVLLANQVQSSPETGYGNMPFKAAGGNIFAHASTYRIFLRKSNRNRIARMVDSPNHPESEIVFTINESGITDPKTSN